MAGCTLRAVRKVSLFVQRANLLQAMKVDGPSNFVLSLVARLVANQIAEGTFNKHEHHLLLQ